MTREEMVAERLIRRDGTVEAVNQPLTTRYSVIHQTSRRYRGLPPFRHLGRIVPRRGPQGFPPCEGNFSQNAGFRVARWPINVYLAANQRACRAG